MIILEITYVDFLTEIAHSKQSWCKHLYVFDKPIDFSIDLGSYVILPEARN